MVSLRTAQPATSNSQNGVISMTANQPTARPRATQAVRRVTRAFKRVNDEQILMWEAFWRTNRFPTD